MSKSIPSETKVKGLLNAVKRVGVGRIPRRITAGRHSCAKKTVNADTIITVSTTEIKRSGTSLVTKNDQTTQNGTQCSVNKPRPRSANRVSDGYHTKTGLIAPRLNKPERDRSVPAAKRPSIIPRRTNASILKNRRAAITVPVNNDSKSGDKRSLDLYNSSHINEQDPLNNQHDVVQFKRNYQHNVMLFEQMRNELNDKQRAVMEFYALMKNTRQNILTLGENVDPPANPDLSIINVSNLSPEQLLKLLDHTDNENNLNKCGLNIDLNKINNMPSNIVYTCEQALNKSKEIIDWFSTIVQSGIRGIKLGSLVKKLNEFNAEAEMLSSTVGKVKDEFLCEVHQLIGCLRKSVNDTMTLHVKVEEMTVAMSDLQSQNTTLRKQLRNAEHLRVNTNRAKVEELEKELKDEKCKKMIMKNRLTSAEGQFKMTAEKANQLESALEQARSQIWTLERTVQQLRDQNANLESSVDVEINNLRESIVENTKHLEDIERDRDKLQNEKECLERKLCELSEHYDQSLNNMKQETNANIVKLIETEKKYNNELENKAALEKRIESLGAQLLESQLRYKDVCKDLIEKEIAFNKSLELENQLDNIKKELQLARCEAEEHKQKFAEQMPTMKNLEQNFKEALNLVKTLKTELENKEECISELEKGHTILEEQLQESDTKMGDYKEQLSSLRSQLSQLQSVFGECGDLDEYRKMVHQQRAQLLEATRQNGELAEALQRKELDLEQHIDNANEQVKVLDEKDEMIKRLSEKEEEQSNIIKRLNKNLKEQKEISKKLSELEAEVESLEANLETRKQQVSQLEKIILTLEDQTRKASLQRRNDQERIIVLEKKVAQYETYYSEVQRSVKSPSRDNLDNLIKILEEELQSPDDIISRHNYRSGCNRVGDSRNTVQEARPTKIVLGNYVKRTFDFSLTESKADLDRKKAITRIEPERNDYSTLPLEGTDKLSLLMSNQERNDRKYKRMFKFAGHRM